MTTKELETEILNFIEDYYQCKYTKKIKVVIKDITYITTLSLNNDNRPLIIIYEGDDYLNFIKAELKRRRLTDITYYRGYKNE